MSASRRRARQREIAAYVTELRRINHGVGAADAARLARQDGRDYSEPEIFRVMSDMHAPGFPF